MNNYQIISKVIIAALFVGVPLHTILLASDSDAYRWWVYVQMSIFVAAGISLWLALKPNWSAAYLFCVLTIPATYINAVYLNYGNGLIVWVIPFSLLSGFIVCIQVAKGEQAGNA